MTDREKAAARIRALRNMTVENGCSEAEAMLAAEKLAEALRDYNMTLDEADLRASPFAEDKHTGAGSVGLKLWKVAGAIAKLTGAKQWRDGGNAAQITFLGFRHEVEVATYMLRLCERAMHTEVARHMRGTEKWPMGRRAARLVPFIDGMADRLRQRILAMLPPLQAGTGLIVLRGALIDAEVERRGYKLETNTARRSVRGDSYGAGVAAGERVALNKGLEGATEAKARLR